MLIYEKNQNKWICDKMIAKLIGKTEKDIYKARKALDVNFEYNEVDTCAAEFKALTPYLYSTTNITKLQKLKNHLLIKSNDYWWRSKQNWSRY